MKVYRPFLFDPRITNVSRSDDGYSLDGRAMSGWQIHHLLREAPFASAPSARGSGQRTSRKPAQWFICEKRQIFHSYIMIVIAYSIIIWDPTARGGCSF